MIVVLVILAILAAMLVPALLGWIDEAKKKNYELEARSVYMAAQAVADEMYAAGTTTLPATIADDATGNNLTRLKELVTDVTVNSVTGISGTGMKISAMTTEFVSGNGKTVEMQLAGGKWTKNSES